MPENIHHDWLVIALIYNHQHYDELYKDTVGYKTMEAQKNHLFNNINDMNFNDKINVVLVENRLNFVKENDIVVGVSEVINIEQRVKNKFKPVEKDDQTSVNSMTDAESVIKIITIIKTKFPAKRHILITYGHGSIFGINLITSPNSAQTLNKAALKQKKASSVKVSKISNAWYNEISYFKPLDNKSTTYSYFKNKKIFIEPAPVDNKEKVEKIVHQINNLVILTNKELADIISKVYNKLDVLIMYNCLMQNVYIQYELRNCVDYLVAPEGGIGYPGYYYTKALNDLAVKPDQSNKEAASLFHTTIRDNDKYNDYKKAIEAKWKIISLQLNGQQYDDIYQSFKSFADQLNQVQNPENNLFMCLNNTLNGCFNYAHNCLNNSFTQIDLLNFLRYMLAQINMGFPSLYSIRPVMQKLIRQLMKVKEKNTFFIGNSFFPENIGFTDADNDSNTCFGFVLQVVNYPGNSIQAAIMTDSVPEYFPSFLEGTAYREFYKKYAAYNAHFTHAPDPQELL